MGNLIFRLRYLPCTAVLLSARCSRCFGAGSFRCRGFLFTILLLASGTCTGASVPLHLSVPFKSNTLTWKQSFFILSLQFMNNSNFIFQNIKQEFLINLLVLFNNFNKILLFFVLKTLYFLLMMNPFGFEVFVDLKFLKICFLFLQIF